MRRRLFLAGVAAAPCSVISGCSAIRDDTARQPIVDRFALSTEVENSPFDSEELPVVERGMDAEFSGEVQVSVKDGEVAVGTAVRISREATLVDWDAETSRRPPPQRYPHQGVPVEHEFRAIGWLSGRYTADLFVRDRHSGATTGPVSRTFEVVRPALLVTDIEPFSATRERGRLFSPTVTVANDGNAMASTDVVVQLDGETVATEPVTVAGGSQRAVRLGIPTDDLDPVVYKITAAADATGVVGTLRITE